MNLKNINENTFKQNKNSPKVDKDVQHGTFFNMPKKINWGDEIPIYGYLKNPEEILSPNNMAAFGIHVRNATGDAFLNDSTNFNLGNPLIRKSLKPYEILTNKKEVYFNTVGTNIYQVLEPGDYTVSIYHFNIESELKKLTVAPAGWRKEVSDFLFKEICKGNLYKKLQEYADILEMQSVTDLAPGATWGNSAEIAWRKGFAGYKKFMRPEWLKGMKSEHKIDLGVGSYTQKLLTEKCLSKAFTSFKNSAVSIYDGMKKYESKDETPKK